MSSDAAELVDVVPATYADAVAVLAEAHASGDEQIVIYSVPDPAGRIVRLMEVSDAFPDAGVERPVTTGGREWVVPVFPMGPSPDFPFRSEIAQVTHDEWRRLREGTLILTRDWGDLNRAAKVAEGGGGD